MHMFYLFRYNSTAVHWLEARVYSKGGGGLEQKSVPALVSWGRV